LDELTLRTGFEIELLAPPGSDRQADVIAARAGGHVRRGPHADSRPSPVPGSQPRPGHRGWYRLVTDDVRLLRLVRRHVDPCAPPTTRPEPPLEAPLSVRAR